MRPPIFAMVLPMADLRSPVPSNALETLPARERELLELAARPMSAKEIAQFTALSVGTVNNYLSSAQRRLGARNRVEAVRMFRGSVGDGADKVHVNFLPVPDDRPPPPRAMAEPLMSDGMRYSGLADSVAPRSRSSLEAFLGSSDRGLPSLPRPGQLSWQKRLCAILVIAIFAAFLMSSVVILLDALTRLTTTS